MNKGQVTIKRIKQIVKNHLNDLEIKVIITKFKTQLNRPGNIVKAAEERS